MVKAKIVVRNILLGGRVSEKYYFQAMYGTYIFNVWICYNNST